MIMRWWCQIYMVAEDLMNSIILQFLLAYQSLRSRENWRYESSTGFYWRWLVRYLDTDVSFVLDIFWLCFAYPILCWADIHRNVDWYDMYVSLVHLSRNMILIYWNYTQQLSFHDIQASNRTCNNDQEYLWSNDMLHALWHYKHCEDRWMWLSLWR